MKSRSFLRSFILLLVLVLSLMPLTVGAQEGGPSDDDVNAVAKQLFCPVCENIPLDTCGTAACEQWRGIIREKLSEGWTEDQIKNYFVEQYGDRVLAEPPAQGFNWVVYLVPAVIFISGGYLFIKGFQSWRTQTDTPDRDERINKPANQNKYSEHDLSRVEEELRKRSKE